MISRLFLPLSSLASKGSIPWSSDQRNRHVHTHKGKSLPSRVLFPPCGVCCGCPEHFTVEMMSVKPTYQHLKGSANLIACGPCLSRQFCDSVCDKCSLCGRAPRDKRPAQDPPGGKRLKDCDETLASQDCVNCWCAVLWDVNVVIAPDCGRIGAVCFAH